MLYHIDNNTVGVGWRWLTVFHIVLLIMFRLWLNSTASRRRHRDKSTGHCLTPIPAVRQIGIFPLYRITKRPLRGISMGRWWGWGSWQEQKGCGTQLPWGSVSWSGLDTQETRGSNAFGRSKTDMKHDKLTLYRLSLTILLTLNIDIRPLCHWVN